MSSLITRHTLFLSITRFVSLVEAQQFDPIANFCYRAWHQSVIKGSTLYIDGGIESFVAVNETQYGAFTVGYHENITTTSMYASWDWKTNITQNVLPKNPALRTGTVPPSYSGGALYQGLLDDSQIYLYGGSDSYINSSFPGWIGPVPATYSLWALDTTTNEWSQFDLTNANLTNRPSAGAAAEDPSSGLLFYYNGRVDGGSESDTMYLLGGSASLNIPGLIVINTTSTTAHNYSTADASGDWPVNSGSLDFIPSVGTRGALVALGGMAKHIGDSASASAGNYTSFGVVDVFDVGSDLASGAIWYKQNTTGDIPAPRGEFCTGTITDESTNTHNIYLYGGRTVVNNNETTFDDVYVLNIPSFVWTQVYMNGSNPRYGHSCQVINNQLLTIGGVQRYDFEEEKYYQNGYLGCDWEYKSVAILDMSEILWGSVYNGTAGEFKLPTMIKDAVTTGNNTIMQRPSAGFDTVGLAAMFNQDKSAVAPWGKPQTTPQANPTSGTNNAGLIGGIIGGAGGLLVVVFVILLWVKRWNWILGPRSAGDDSAERTASQAKIAEVGSMHETEIFQLPTRPPTAATAISSTSDVVNYLGYNQLWSSARTAASDARLDIVDGQEPDFAFRNEADDFEASKF